MADGYIGVDEPAGVDKKVDTEEITVGANTVHRERLQIAGVGATDLVLPVAHDAADAGNPLKIGGKALSSAPSDVSTTGDRVNAYFDMKGRLVVDASQVPVPITDNASSITVDGTVALGAGSAAIGKLTTNTGVTIGAVELVAAQTLATVTTVGTLTTITTNTPLGTVVHDGADSGAPIKVGTRSIAALSTATIVTSADRHDMVSDTDGALLIRPHVPLGDALTERSTNTDGASTASTVFGATASTRNVINGITVFRTDTGTTMAFVDFRDATGGAVLWTMPLPAGGGSVLPPGVVIKTTANTALAWDVSSALSTVYINLAGYKSKVA